MKFTKVCLWIAFVIIVNGCTSTKKVMDSYLGRTKSNLILNWGPPTNVANDGQGGEIYIYARKIHYQGSSGITTPTYGGGTYTSSPTPGNTFWNYKMFYVNSNGIIYHWKVNSYQIPPNEIILYLR